MAHDTYRSPIKRYQLNSALRFADKRKRQISLPNSANQTCNPVAHKKPRDGGAGSTPKGQKLCRAVA